MKLLVEDDFRNAIDAFDLKAQGIENCRNGIRLMLSPHCTVKPPCVLGIRDLIILNQTLECVTLNILDLKSLDLSLASVAAEVYRRSSC